MAIVASCNYYYTHTHTPHMSLCLFVCVWHVNVANDCCTLLPSDISIFHILSEHHTHTPPLPPLPCPVPTNDTSDDVDVGSTNCSQLKIVVILSLISLIVASAESVGGRRKRPFIVHTLQRQQPHVCAWGMQVYVCAGCSQ